MTHQFHQLGLAPLVRSSAIRGSLAFASHARFRTHHSLESAALVLTLLACCKMDDVLSILEY